MRKIKYENVNVRMSNAADDAREYDIQATVNNIMAVEVGNIEAGCVTKEGTVKAYFNCYGDGMLTINYQPTASSDERSKIIEAINVFVADVKEHIKSHPITDLESVESV